MIWLWTHLITWLVMATLVLLVLFTDSNTKIYEMITRVLYIVAIVSGIFLFGHAWSNNPVLLIVKVIIAIAFIAAIEISFAKKNQGKLNMTMVTVVILLCLVVGILGIILAGGVPTIH
ncbi:YisL family protein [Companilactobacillus allii]|uniref:Uncharacterized protein n=1 Tax=Companilactobacillus allii TaxID=1847728 RepID=A0A1P8Q2R8_9LACO|nr:DUF1516 family protein [Companilactobacillus allii]APX72160.1 hypothetical protein BTM29_06130 [Companilactobacillus allii]USQ69257.1 YisL family protein [Companilactobacillus allii]